MLKKLPAVFAGLLRTLTVYAATVELNANHPDSYTVRKGDTLWSIAHHHDVRIEDLLRWNGLSRTATLRLGQHLRFDAREHTLGGAATAAAAPATP